MNRSQSMQPRAALYARVSSEEQVEGYSIDAQSRAFRTLCSTKLWTPAREYVEEGKSARTEDINKRPVFKACMAEGIGHQYDILVVHKVDRFSRRLRITLEYFDRLAKADVGFVSIMEQMDFSSPWGKFALSMLGGLAELYSDNLSQETKKGWHERRKQGLYCGTLPFGISKGAGEIPIADVAERKMTIADNEVIVRNFDGLKHAFDSASIGLSDREVAMRLNALGYRTTGTHGPREFSRDTVKDMLVNRFYIGYIPDGNGGWLRAMHGPLIDPDLFEKVQQGRRQRRTRGTVNVTARVYSLSGTARCGQCGGHIRIHTNAAGRARAYCASRINGLDCNFRGSFLDFYENQIGSYLVEFVIPTDYLNRILQDQAKLKDAYSNIRLEKSQLEASLARLKQQFQWGHLDESTYLKEFDSVRKRLDELNPIEDRGRELEELARLLSDVSKAWSVSTEPERNRLVKALFEDIVLGSGGVVLAVKPRAQLEPLFRLSYEAHNKSLAGDPEGI
jgi:site-specific DNA recombinase